MAADAHPLRTACLDSIWIHIRLLLLLGLLDGGGAGGGHAPTHGHAHAHGPREEEGGADHAGIAHGQSMQRLPIGMARMITTVSSTVSVGPSPPRRGATR